LDYEIKIPVPEQMENGIFNLIVSDFSLLNFPAIKASQKTKVYVLYDEKFLYFGFICEKKEKNVLSLDDSKHGIMME